MIRLWNSYATESRSNKMVLWTFWWKIRFSIFWCERFTGHAPLPEDFLTVFFQRLDGILRLIRNVSHSSGIVLDFKMLRLAYREISGWSDADSFRFRNDILKHSESTSAIRCSEEYTKRISIGTSFYHLGFVENYLLKRKFSFLRGGSAKLYGVSIVKTIEPRLLIVL